MSDHQQLHLEASSRPRIAPGWVGRLLRPSAISALTLSEGAFEVDGLVRSPPLSFSDSAISRCSAKGGCGLPLLSRPAENCHCSGGRAFR
jgi:hypothetical protein